MFFSSLITPVILLVLYVFFLAKVYRSNFESAMNGAPLPDKLLNGLVAGQLCSSLLAVCCVTVSFCSNLLMVQDKVTGARGDLMVTPAKKYVHALGYYIATAATTLIVCLIAFVGCLIYVACMGWYLGAGDIFLTILDVALLVLFGTALSSVVNFFLSSQGQMSAVGTIVSAGYGFVCGAYMPISFFGKVLQNILTFFPGTYGTALVRNHMLAGAFREMEALGLGSSAIEAVKDGIDCNLYFFGHSVATWASYLVLVLTIVALVAVYVALNVFANKKKK